MGGGLRTVRAELANDSVVVRAARALAGPEAERASGSPERERELALLG